MKQLDWYGLYSDSWKGEIVDEAFSHPAKYSRALIRKIYQHMLDRGLIKPGDKIIDPFGGVALGGYHALQFGLHWTGCELEEKFVQLGNENIDLWNGRYAEHFAKWGTARLLQGDSRNLTSILAGQVDGGLSSPPYGDITNVGERRDPQKAIDAEIRYRKNHPELEGKRPTPIKPYGITDGNLGAMAMRDFDTAVSSPPYAASVNQSAGANDNEARLDRKENAGIDISKADRRGGPNSVLNQPQVYGNTSGQLGSMKEGDYDTAVSSPAYVDTVNSGDGPGVRHDPKTHKGDNAYKATSQAAYGASDGQLGGMNAGDWDAAVSSSPFEASMAGGHSKSGILGQQHNGENKTNGGSFAKSLLTDYGSTDGNIGNDTGQTFWTAARQIVEQTYMVLKPGAYVAFVCGDFVRKGERIYFGRQWMELCEAVGFEPITWAIAWKTEYKGNQLDIFGNDHEKRIDRVSFFRRLANERNPDNAILNEDVIFMRKPM